MNSKHNFARDEKITFIIVTIIAIVSIAILIWNFNESNDVIAIDVSIPETTGTVDISETTETQQETTIFIEEETIFQTEPVIETSIEATTEAIIETLDESPYDKYTEYEGIKYNIGTPSTECEMLAMIIYQENGGDSSCDDCRRRVGDIVLNRVHSDRFPNTIEEVLLQEGQYGELHWTGLKWKNRASNSGEAHAVARAYRIAQEILNGNHSDVYGDYIWQAGFSQGYDEIYHCGHYYGK